MSECQLSRHCWDVEEEMRSQLARAAEARGIVQNIDVRDGMEALAKEYLDLLNHELTKKRGDPNPAADAVLRMLDRADARIEHVTACGEKWCFVVSWQPAAGPRTWAHCWKGSGHTISFAQRGEWMCTGEAK